MTTPQATAARPVPAAVNCVNGGIGINWVGISLEGRDFRRFLHEMLRYAGFRLPETVHFERNKLDETGRPRVDWYRLRISSDECQVNGVNPKDAVEYLRSFLLAEDTTRKYGIRFQLA